MKVTVTSVAYDADNILLDCSDCGPMGSYPGGIAPMAVYEHLADGHNCDMDNVDIVPLTDPDE